MNIAENIARITQGKANIKSTAAKKNIQIPDSDRIDDYASAFDQYWPKCTYGVRYDGLYLIRGTTKKWNQLVNIESYTVNGLTITVNGMNVRIQGTCTASTVVSTGAKPLKNDKFLVYVNYTVRDQLTDNYLFQDGHGAFHQTEIYTHTANNVYQYYFYFEVGDVVDRDIDIQIINLTEIYGTGNEPSDINSQEGRDLIVYASNNPQYDAGSLRYGYYKGIKLGQYDFIDTLDNVLHIGGAEVDIGTFNWDLLDSGQYKFFYSGSLINIIKKPSTQSETTGNKMQFYQEITDAEMNALSLTSDLKFSFNIYGTLKCRNLSYSDSSSFKSAMNGVKFYYELATPIEIDL